MANPKKRRSALGSDPLDAMVPPSDPQERAAAVSTRGLEVAPEEPGAGLAETTPAPPVPEKPKKPAKVRATFHIPEALFEKLRDAVYWTPGLTMAGLASEALQEKLDALVQEHGPFDKREENLKGGRPLGS